MTVYPHLTLPTTGHNKRPFFYANFVSTVDGKGVVATNFADYWPIGSSTDRNTVVELRSYADCIIHGATTALAHRLIDNVKSPAFDKLRHKSHLKNPVSYVVLSGHPTLELQSVFAGAGDVPVYLVTTNEASVPPELDASARVLRFGTSRVDLTSLAKWLGEHHFGRILVEGGPHVFGSFFAEGLIDEIFLTIAPKIFGNDNHQTLTFVEGHLFAAKDTPKLKLISAKPVDDELYLRYRTAY